MFRKLEDERNKIFLIFIGFLETEVNEEEEEEEIYFKNCKI